MRVLNPLSAINWKNFKLDTPWPTKITLLDKIKKKNKFFIKKLKEKKFNDKKIKIKKLIEILNIEKYIIVWSGNIL